MGYDTLVRFWCDCPGCDTYGEEESITEMLDHFALVGRSWTKGKLRCEECQDHETHPHRPDPFFSDTFEVDGVTYKKTNPQLIFLPLKGDPDQTEIVYFPTPPPDEDPISDREDTA